jgi:hypothetical protein
VIAVMGPDRRERAGRRAARGVRAGLTTGT